MRYNLYVPMAIFLCSISNVASSQGITVNVSAAPQFSFIRNEGDRDPTYDSRTSLRVSSDLELLIISQKNMLSDSMSIIPSRARSIQQTDKKEIKSRTTLKSLLPYFTIPIFRISYRLLQK